MKLIKFRVTNFRSVEDSGIIEAEDVLSLIGINEAGKSNLLLPLWKLNPARDGQINLLADMPRKKYSVMRDQQGQVTFIRAWFETSSSFRTTLAEKIGDSAANVKILEISRKYDGSYAFDFSENPEAMPAPEKKDEVTKLILQCLPKFVYYSHYGNLDSDIHLPRVIEDLNRKDLTAKEEAKTRTLKVLFDYVNLKPQEILTLGRADDGTPNSMEKKREREVLLHSAASKLTSDFREWWKQGEYQFQLRADGNFFKIWVSDSQRPEPIELEGRSTGLQWFLSFFLVFLAEARDSHQDCILLLDEPGLTLHALAQTDLTKFFDNLAKDNQIIYSTHSPFLIESDKLDRVRAVYVNEKGETEATPDLRAAAPGSVRQKSVFAAHAALGLAVAETFLNGSFPIIVEGPSDQHYMSLIKGKLLQNGFLRTTKEVVFLPGGGAKGIKTLAPIVSGKTNELPYVLLDSDVQGKQMAESLRSGLYKDDKNKIVLVGEILGRDNVEVEDLINPVTIAKIFSKQHHSSMSEMDFDESFDTSLPLVNQMEKYAASNGIDLPDGWKVALAKEVKRRGLADRQSIVDADRLNWTRLFEKLSVLETQENLMSVPVRENKSPTIDISPV